MFSVSGGEYKFLKCKFLLFRELTVDMGRVSSSAYSSSSISSYSSYDSSSSSCLYSISDSDFSSNLEFK